MTAAPRACTVCSKPLSKGAGGNLCLEHYRATIQRRAPRPCAVCAKPLSRKTKGELCAKHATEARNADPAHRAMLAAMVRTNHVQNGKPRRWPQCHLNLREAADYNTLRQRGGYTVEQALVSIKRADLLEDRP
jgi:hypothetical protein